MSMTQAVREFFLAHPNQKFDNATLRDKLNNDDGQAISVALNLMHNNGEVKREPRPTGTGYRYWMGTAKETAASTAAAHAVKGRDTRDDDDLPPMPAATVKLIERVVKKVEAEKKPAKRKYKKRQAPPPGARRVDGRCRHPRKWTCRRDGCTDRCDVRHPGRWRNRHRHGQLRREPAARGSAAPAGLPSNRSTALE